MILAAVVVTWNSANYIGACLRALAISAAAAGIELRVIVVDNASTDGSAEVAAQHATVVIRNAENGGFAVAACQGLASAEADWNLVINPDLVVTERFISALVRHASQVSGDVGVLVPDVRYALDPSVVNHRGIAIDQRGVPFERSAGTVAEDLPVRTVFGGSGGAMAISRVALTTAGGFEPCFFAYLEDAELACRLNRLGFGAEYVPTALAFHQGSVSLGEGSPAKAWLVGRNRRFLFRLHPQRTVTARVGRAVVEIAHTTYTCVQSRSVAPLAGRLSSRRHRRYLKFMTRSELWARMGPSSEMPVEPTNFRSALLRKRAGRVHTKNVK